MSLMTALGWASWFTGWACLAITLLSRLPEHAWGVGFLLLPLLALRAYGLRHTWAREVEFILQQASLGLACLFRLDYAWLMAACAASLAGWDLAHFDRQLGHSRQVVAQKRLELAHLGWLLVALLLGLGLGALTLNLRLKLDFVIVCLLGLFAVLGVARLVKRSWSPEGGTITPAELQQLDEDSRSSRTSGR